MSKQNLNALREVFEHALDQQLRYVMTPIEMLKPMIYSLKNGGKRLRPVLLLTMLSAQSSDQIKKGLKTAMALEYIHTYSLIHDDLPAMDNDDLRRGQPTNHKQFDEATAILAGDALLTDAFGLIAQDELLTSDQRIQLVIALSQSAGSLGMVAGQLDDMKAQANQMTLDKLQAIHSLKTGELFVFAARAAAIIGELDAHASQHLVTFAQHFGKAYQIHNDLLDVIGSQSQTGKRTHADEKLDKVTYPSFIGLSQTQVALQDEIEAARATIELLSQVTGRNYQALAGFLDYLALDIEE
ncbi:polyprenyl synthetase family protein [Vaginisenegalia massiliensis]|uniref:polyprenyl synthetase family protein n=1 Tax=Vaginisenegalia massiliensis TaxID=2058294 RepID=UPI000F534C6F|nr:farnesyl diphosphate synthase [Vaginisenegalia massiliensis]